MAAAITYENGLIPEALLAGGRATTDRDLIDRGLVLLDWLDRAQTAPEGHATPIGNHGWWPRDGGPARFDQQPIEPWSMVAAAARATEVTGDASYADVARRHFDWFLGRNDVGVPLARPTDGSCHDGLGPSGVNANQGAESTIAWLSSVEIMRGLVPSQASVSARRLRLTQRI